MLWLYAFWFVNCVNYFAGSDVKILGMQNFWGTVVAAKCSYVLDIDMAMLTLLICVAMLGLQGESVDNKAFDGEL